MAGGRWVRPTVCAIGALAVVGHQMVAFPGDFGIAMVWILAASTTSGLVACVRIDPLAEGDVARARARLSRSNRRLGVDLLAVVLIQLVGAYAFAIAALAGGDDDETLWFVPAVLGVLSIGAWCLGLVAGLLVLRPLAELGRVVVRAVRGQEVDGRRALLASLLLTTVGLATTISLAVDSEASGRRFVGASLPVLLTGVESDTTTVASVPLLWAARVFLLALVAELVLLVRGGPGRGQRR